MTSASATMGFTAPTRVERGLLRVASRLTILVERRVKRRAEQREIALEMLREQQTRKPDLRAVDLALTHMGLPLR